MDEINGKDPAKDNHPIWRGALAVFGVLFVIYLITFSGRFTSVDELALYAMTESLVQNGDLETPQLTFASYHNPVGNLEPGLPIVAAPLYWLSQQFDHLNNIQVVMLVNPLATAATAGLLYAIARILGYSKRGSLFAALTFGLATLSWPYARTLYREPLVGVAWMFGLLGLVLWQRDRRIGWLLAAVIALVLTLIVKVTAVSAIPFLFLAALAGFDKNHLRRRNTVAVISLIIVAVILFVVVFSWRFGSIFDQRVIAAAPLWTWIQRMYGQLLSPGKGLLFYMPAVLLTIPGLVLMWRRHRVLVVAIALPLLATAAAYSLYGSWYGGQSWGPRFLVPAIPPLMLSLAALWDETRNRWLRILFLLLVALSVVAQLAVVTADWWPGYEPLFESGPDPEENAGLRLDRLDLSPPLVQLREWSAEHLDLLWLQADQDGSILFSPLLVLPLIAVLAAIIVIGWLSARGRVKSAWLVPILLLSVALLLVFGPGATPGYAGLPQEQAREIARWSTDVNAEPSTLVTMSNDFSIYYFLGFLKGDFTHHWYSPDQTEGFEPILEDNESRWLSLFLDRVHKDPRVSGKDLEWWLNEQLFRAESSWVGGYELVRYAAFPSTEWTWNDVDTRFGDSFLLRRYALNQDRFSPGETVGLQVEVCSAGAMPEYHHLFTHLVSGQAQVNGFDGPLRYGGLVLLPWKEGDCLIERRAFLIPPDTPPGDYDLIAGFDTPDGLLAADDGSGSLADYTVLRQVAIEE